MKTILCLFVLFALTFARPDAEKYSDRYDNIDVGEILFNERLLAAYIKCLMDEGNCTAEGTELKSHIKEALENNCGKCTEAQKNGTKKVIGHLINHKKESWEKLSAKYDPDHKYTAKYEKELKTVAA